MFGKAALDQMNYGQICQRKKHLPAALPTSAFFHPFLYHSHVSFTLLPFHAFFILFFSRFRLSLRLLNLSPFLYSLSLSLVFLLTHHHYYLYHHHCRFFFLIFLFFFFSSSISLDLSPLSTPSLPRTVHLPLRGLPV